MLTQPRRGASSTDLGSRPGDHDHQVGVATSSTTATSAGILEIGRLKYRGIPGIHRHFLTDWLSLRPRLGGAVRLA